MLRQASHDYLKISPWFLGFFFRGSTKVSSKEDNPYFIFLNKVIPKRNNRCFVYLNFYECSLNTGHKRHSR